MPITRSQSESYILYDSNYMTFLKVRTIEIVER